MEQPPIIHTTPSLLQCLQAKIVDLQLLQILLAL